MAGDRPRHRTLAECAWAGRDGLLGGAAGLDALIYPRFRTALRRKPETRKLAIPVMVYGFILSLMMLSAVATLFRSEWTNVWIILLIAAGGILFFISDNIKFYVY